MLEKFIEDLKQIPKERKSDCYIRIGVWNTPAHRYFPSYLYWYTERLSKFPTIEESIGVIAEVDTEFLRFYKESNYYIEIVEDKKEITGTIENIKVAQMKLYNTQKNKNLQALEEEISNMFSMIELDSI